MARIIFGVRRRWLRSLGALVVLTVALFWRYTASQSDWRIRDTLPTEFEHVYDLALSPDSTVLAVLGGDDYISAKTAQLWHLPTRRVLKTFETRDEDDWIVSVEFSPNGRSFAINSSDGVEIWDRDSMTRRVICELSRKAHGMKCIAYSPDGTTLAGVDRFVGHIWDVNTGSEIATFSTTHSYSIAFSPDGNWIASGGALDEIVVYNLATCESRTLSVLNWIGSVAFSPEGKTLAAVESGITLWNVGTWSKKATLEIPRITSGVAFSPDGAYFAIGGFQTDAQWRKRLPLIERCLAALGIERQFEGVIHVYNAKTLQQVTTLKSHADGVPDCVFSADSRTLITCGYDDTVLFWEVPD